VVLVSVLAFEGAGSYRQIAAQSRRSGNHQSRTFALVRAAPAAERPTMVVCGGCEVSIAIGSGRAFAYVREGPTYASLYSQRQVAVPDARMGTMSARHAKESGDRTYYIRIYTASSPATSG
jgi:hypothetical protein